MIIKNNSINPIEFNGLKIADYTGNNDEKSSFAIIDASSGVVHGLSLSKKPDKYYYIISGEIKFTINSQDRILTSGDFCIIKKGEKFNYIDNSNKDAQLVLVHTPNFDIKEEVFE